MVWLGVGGSDVRILGEIVWTQLNQSQTAGVLSRTSVELLHSTLLFVQGR